MTDEQDNYANLAKLAKIAKRDDQLTLGAEFPPVPRLSVGHLLIFTLTTSLAMAFYRGWATQQSQWLQGGSLVVARIWVFAGALVVGATWFGCWVVLTHLVRHRTSAPFREFPNAYFLISGLAYMAMIAFRSAFTFFESYAVGTFALAFFSLVYLAVAIGWIRYSFQSEGRVWRALGVLEFLLSSVHCLQLALASGFVVSYRYGLGFSLIMVLLSLLEILEMLVATYALLAHSRYPASQAHWLRYLALVLIIAEAVYHFARFLPWIF